MLSKGRPSLSCQTKMADQTNPHLVIVRSQLSRRAVADLSEMLKFLRGLDHPQSPRMTRILVSPNQLAVLKDMNLFDVSV